MTSVPIRMTDRLFLDEAARDFSGGVVESTSYVAQWPANSGYLDRSASFASYSSKGGVGGAFATRASDQYTQFPGVIPGVWVPGATGVLGQRVAYQGRVYDITVGGVFSGVAPTHTAGAAANGTATLTFVDFTYMVPIAGSFFAIQDSADLGTSVWAIYGETVNTTAASSFIAEFAAKNRSAVNPVTNPYAKFSTAMGLCLAAGGDPAVSPATNPSSHAVLIYKNGHTWNTGIVFAADGITGTDGVTGYGQAIKLARGHVIQWQYAGGDGFAFVSTVDAPTDKQTLVIDGNGASFLNNNSLAAFRVAKIAGNVTGNLAVAASLSGSPFIQAEGSAANIDIGYTAKGTGRHLFSANVNLAAGKVFSINNTQVVGPRGAAVADATDAASAITQLNALLARLRAHGLIAP